jgi:hypothetical protein
MTNSPQSSQGSTSPVLLRKRSPGSGQETSRSNTSGYIQHRCGSICYYHAYEVTAPATRVILFPTTLASISIHHQLISSLLDKQLHEQFTTVEYWEYLHDKYNWTAPTYKLIAWDSYHASLHKQTSTQHRQELMKYTNGWLPMGHYNHRNDPIEEHCSPHCFTVYKKGAHILQCPHPEC